MQCVECVHRFSPSFAVYECILKVLDERIVPVFLTSSLPNFSSRHENIYDV